LVNRENTTGIADEWAASSATTARNYSTGGSHVGTVDLLRALQEVEKRAERVSDEHVIATYVGAGSLVQALTTKDNGILFGRRGTGKTHALKYLAETERAKGNFVVYIDMEQDIGSTEGRYVDMSLPVAERATRLLVDVLSIIHDRLVEDAFAGRAKSQIDTLDRALDHFGEVVVVETAEKETTAGRETEVSGRGAIDLSSKGPSVSVGASDRDKSMSGGRYKVSGPIRHRVHFGALGKLLREVVSSHEADRCWILLDEWSGVPLDLQPYLAEMLRRHSAECRRGRCLPGGYGSCSRPRLRRLARPRSPDPECTRRGGSSSAKGSSFLRRALTSARGRCSTGRGEWVTASAGPRAEVTEWQVPGRQS